MRYVGLESHLRQSTFCVLDGNGQRVQTRTIHGSWKVVLKELDALPKPFAVCFEASVDYGFLFERLSRIAARVPMPLIWEDLARRFQPRGAGVSCAWGSP